MHLCQSEVCLRIHEIFQRYINISSAIAQLVPRPNRGGGGEWPGVYCSDFHM